jgi:DNA processing protein
LVIILKPGDGGYPMGLADLEHQPNLFLLGRLEKVPAVAVVGTRRATTYGLGLAREFGRVIAEAGWATVSGLAWGIDAAVHAGTLDGGGHAVAVMGSGADVCYPKANLPLYRRIIDEGGGVLSEYAPGTPPDRWRFPARNRIIAAISRAVVVVEAAERGGALITARLGAEMGRSVFAVPGDVDRPASAGCNLLIKDGAHPVLGAQDLIAELELVLGPGLKLPHSSDIPQDGIDIESLARLWGIGLPETLVRVGRAELEGRLRKIGDLVFRSGSPGVGRPPA